MHEKTRRIELSAIGLLLATATTPALAHEPMATNSQEVIISTSHELFSLPGVSSLGLGPWPGWKAHDLKFGMADMPEQSGFGITGYAGAEFGSYWGSTDSYLESQTRLSYRLPMGNGLGIAGGLYIDAYADSYSSGLSAKPYIAVDSGPHKVALGYGPTAMEYVLPKDRLQSPLARQMLSLSYPVLRYEGHFANGTMVSASTDGMGTVEAAGYGRIGAGFTSAYGGIRLYSGSVDEIVAGMRYRPSDKWDISGKITAWPTSDATAATIDGRYDVSDRLRLYAGLELGRDSFGSFSKIAGGVQYGIAEGTHVYGHASHSTSGFGSSDTIAFGIKADF